MRDYPSCQAREFTHYPGTAYDCINVSEGGCFYADELVDSKAGRFITGWGIIVPLHIIDLPISILTDTLLLPRDMSTEKRNRDKLINLVLTIFALSTSIYAHLAVLSTFLLPCTTLTVYPNHFENGHIDYHYTPPDIF